MSQVETLHTDCVGCLAMTEESSTAVLALLRMLIVEGADIPGVVSDLCFAHRRRLDLPSRLEGA